MTSNNDWIEPVVRRAVSIFYEARMKKIHNIRLGPFLRRTNPYLLRASAMYDGPQLIARALSSHMGLSDASRFGKDFFERVFEAIPGVRIVATEGVDFERDLDETVEGYSLKSGTNQLNSGEMTSVDRKFATWKRVLRTHGVSKRPDAILAYAYGRKIDRATQTRTHSHFRYMAGQELWAHVTGERDFYLRLMRLLGDVSKEKRHTLRALWTDTEERLREEFQTRFCYRDGLVDWENLTVFISGNLAESTEMRGPAIRRIDDSF